MCGIWLALLLKNSSFGKYYEHFMNFKMRGPENSIFNIINCNNKNAMLGFHRLAINGLFHSTANQPFIYDETNYTVYVMCNGEIYNYKNLAAEYDFDLKTGSDCEVIYPLYKLFGEKMVEKLDGVATSSTKLDNF